MPPEELAVAHQNRSILGTRSVDRAAHLSTISRRRSYVFAALERTRRSSTTSLRPHRGRSAVLRELIGEEHRRQRRR
jgi:hypothetical protein